MTKKILIENEKSKVDFGCNKTLSDRVYLRRFKNHAEPQTIPGILPLISNYSKLVRSEQVNESAQNWDSI